MAFQFLLDYESSPKSSALSQLSADFEQQKQFYYTRRKET
jgi:hypothetical protein